MPRKYYGQGTMDKAVRLLLDKQKLEISDEALAVFEKDEAEILDGKLKSPSTDWVFIWDKTSGRRFLFKGIIDPPTET